MCEPCRCVDHRRRCHKRHVWAKRCQCSVVASRRLVVSCLDFHSQRNTHLQYYWLNRILLFLFHKVAWREAASGGRVDRLLSYLLHYISHRDYSNFWTLLCETTISCLTAARYAGRRISSAYRSLSPSPCFITVPSRIPPGRETYSVADKNAVVCKGIHASYTFTNSTPSASAVELKPSSAPT